MGTCISSEKLPDNFFRVRNIHDDNSHYPKGVIEVTSVELIYTDAKSRDRWVWPLKYLRKYGNDNDIFSFEAGRKSPGGEGLYAFSTKKAATLFQMVARNINADGLLPDAEASHTLSPQSSGQASSLSPISPGPPTLPPAHPPTLPPTNPPTLPPTNPPTLPPTNPPTLPPTNPPTLPPTNPPTLPPSIPSSRPPVNHPLALSTSPPHHVLINYENLLYKDGQRVPENGSIVGPLSPPPLLQDRRPLGTPSPPSSANLPPPKLNYLEVSFSDHPADSLSTTSLPAVEVKEERRVSYSKIDIQQTEEYKRAAEQEAALASRALPVLGGTTFIDPSSIPTHKKGGGRVRLPTYHGSSSNRSHSDSSVGSPNSLVGSVRDVQVHANGEVPTRHHSSVSAAETSMYQNLTVSPNGPLLQIPQQHNYMNLDLPKNTTPQPSLNRKPSEQSSMYENLTLGQNGISPKIATNSSPNPSLVTTVPRVSGGAMSTYADLDLRQTSTPKSKGPEEKPREKGGKVEAEPSYPVLEFHTQNGAIKNTTPAPSDGRSSPKPSEISLASVRENQSNSKLADDKVTYGMLDFQAMDVMRNLVRECEADREEEGRRREEEKRKKLEKESRSKKKKKEKDRKNSHN